ncbi:MAG: PKD domain-containing protein, partial [Planctomycetota bacterium]
ATAARADNGDGNGTALSRDATTDTNSASDVFVAAISAQEIETRAFSQSLAGKFRHPRCTTCHSMQAADTNAFVSAAATGQPHAGPPPGPTFPNNDPATCTQCHTTQTSFPIPTWQAPAASFDMRRDTVAQLADRATRIPTGDLEHFVSDARVLWALDTGILPTAGGRNGIADDDHDGIDEPEDRDGTADTVPGGSVTFLREIQDWIASGRVVSAASAVRDLTLVSRANATTNAANGASGKPKVVWVANPGFNPTSSAAAFGSNPVGTLFVVYESTAGDIAGTDANGVADVFRAAVEVRAEQDPVTGAQLAGGLNLVLVGTTLASARDSTPATAGNGASTDPVIGGSSGEIVAFQSLATDLVAGINDTNVAADVFVRRTTINNTVLVSQSAAGAQTGDGVSEKPALSSNGRGIAFDSAASDLINGDTNAARDVFHARIADAAGAPLATPFTKVRSSVTSTGAEGTGGSSSAASVHLSDADRFLVAFESTMTNLAPAVGAATNVFLFDSTTGFTTLLNQRVSTAGGNALGNGIAQRACITSDGSRVAFQSAADNIDVLRTSDGNRATDVFLVETPPLASGNVLPFRLSMTATEAADANGASTGAFVGSFANSTLFPAGIVAYQTAATNLGTSDSTDLMVSFLSESSGVFADFTATPVRGAGPLSVTFTDRSTGNPTAWQWDFTNDGTVDSTEQNPTFVYTTPGTFTVRLVATNSRSSGERVATNLILVVSAPDADFNAVAPIGIAPFSVSFTDTSTQSPTSWAWDFTNDGTVDSTAQNPTGILYPTTGRFTVRLVVTNEAGTSTETKTDFVQALLAASFTMTVGVNTITSAYELTNITFTSTTPGNPTSFAWDFDSVANPGTLTSTLSSVARNFPNTTASTRTFVVRLIVDGPAGAAVATQNLTIVSDTEVATLNPSADATIYQEATALSNGAGTGIFVGRTAGSLTLAGAGPAALSRRGLLQFNVGSIPSGSTINSASIDLNISQALNTGARQIAFRRLLVTWVEGTSVGGGQGVAAAGGGATWANRRTAPNVPWGVAGGQSGTDFVATASAFANIAAGLAAAATTTDNGANSIRADVQLWVNGTANNGWILIGDESVITTVKRILSRENGASVPVLNVNFTRPLP